MSRRNEAAGTGAPAVGSEDGAAFGRYRGLRLLAIGGMAEVFLARATGAKGFETPVVLKRIRRDRAHDGAFVRMFLDEARLCARLQHPGIAQVFDFGQVDGEYFLAMEYVEGPSLQKLLDVVTATGGAVPLEHALTISVAVASALHHAHERSDVDGRSLAIIHRDVSPSNVVVSFDGAVKLLDFGIARSTARSGVTRPQDPKGKAAYMSPEQCGDEPLDRRSDVFSLGTVLFEMTTGRVPFDGHNDLAIVHRITTQDAPSPTAVRADYPPALAAIVLGALARDRDRRTATCLDLARALESFATSAGLTLSPLALGAYVSGLIPRGDRSESSGLQAGVQRPIAAAPAAGARVTAPVPAPESREASAGGVPGGVTLPLPAPHARAGHLVWLVRNRMLAGAAVVALVGLGALVMVTGRARPHVTAATAPSATALTTAPRAPTRENTLLVNGGFEGGRQGWRALHADMAITQSVPHGGAAACRVCRRAADTDANSYRLSDEPGAIVNPRAGERYAASAWVRAVPGARGPRRVKLALREKDRPGAPVTESAATVDIDETWRHIAVTHAMTTDRPELNVMVGVSVTPGSPASDDECFLVDDVTLAKN